jgi:hypothetical protein
MLPVPSEHIANDPFEAYLEVPVAGGTVNVARAGPPPKLAVHGISAAVMRANRIETWVEQ